MPEEPKARLLQLYDGEAADCYRKVVLEHAAAQHVEDAKDRLAVMNLPIPTPTKAQYDASVALENSRSSYKITDYAKLFFMHVPDTVMASHMGEPPLTDAKATTAPQVLKKANSEFLAAFTPAPAGSTPLPAPKTDVAPAPAAAIAPAAPAAPLSFQDVPTAAPGGNPAGTVMSAPLGNSSTMPGSTGIGVEIINQPSSGAGKTPPDPNNPLKAVKPADQGALPDAEAAAPAPDVPNQVTAATPAGQTPSPDGKNPKVKTDKKDESSSKDKPKTGIEKIIPHL
jgi:outer membrane protein assembly factor BamD